MSAEDLVREIRDTHAPAFFVISREAAFQLAKEHDNATTMRVIGRMLYNRDLRRGTTEPPTACDKCGGFGICTYASTATYHGGAGGMQVTRDICNQCWGSGVEGAPWASLRAFNSLLKQRDEARAEVALLKEALAETRTYDSTDSARLNEARAYVKRWLDAQ